MTQIGFGYGFCYYRSYVMCIVVYIYILNCKKINIEFFYILIVQNNNFVINESIMICM